MMRELLTKKRS